MVATTSSGQEIHNQELSEMAHLMRRAGFGATFQELEQALSEGYEATVERLLHPEDAPEWDDTTFRRYHVDQNSVMLIESASRIGYTAWSIHRGPSRRKSLSSGMACLRRHTAS